MNDERFIRKKERERIFDLLPYERITPTPKVYNNATTPYLEVYWILKSMKLPKDVIKLILSVPICKLRYYIVGRRSKKPMNLSKVIWLHLKGDPRKIDYYYDDLSWSILLSPYSEYSFEERRHDYYEIHKIKKKYGFKWKIKQNVSFNDNVLPE